MGRKGMITFEFYRCQAFNHHGNLQGLSLEIKKLRVREVTFLNKSNCSFNNLLNIQPHTYISGSIKDAGNISVNQTDSLPAPMGLIV